MNLNKKLFLKKLRTTRYLEVLVHNHYKMILKKDFLNKIDQFVKKLLYEYIFICSYNEVLCDIQSNCTTISSVI